MKESNDMPRISRAEIARWKQAFKNYLKEQNLEVISTKQAIYMAIIFHIFTLPKEKIEMMIKKIEEDAKKQREINDKFMQEALNQIK